MRNILVHRHNRTRPFLVHLDGKIVTKIPQVYENFSAVLALPFGKLGIRTVAGQITELCYLPPHAEAKEPADATVRMPILPNGRARTAEKFSYACGIFVTVFLSKCTKKGRVRLC